MTWWSRRSARQPARHRPTSAGSRAPPRPLLLDLHSRTHRMCVLLATERPGRKPREARRTRRDHVCNQSFRSVHVGQRVSDRVGYDKRDQHGRALRSGHLCFNRAGRNGHHGCNVHCQPKSRWVDLLRRPDLHRGDCRGNLHAGTDPARPDLRERDDHIFAQTVGTSSTATFQLGEVTGV